METPSDFFAAALVARLHRCIGMWLVLQRIVAGIGRVLRRPWASHRRAPSRTRP